MAEDRPVFAAHVDGDAIYALLLSVDKKVDRIQEAVTTTQNRVEDHEVRLRELESHGSPNSQEIEREMLRTRERLHNIEGTQSFQTAVIKENADGIKAVAASVKSTTSTLVKVCLLLLSVCLTAAATFIVFTALG